MDAFRSVGLFRRLQMLRRKDHVEHLVTQPFQNAERSAVLIQRRSRLAKKRLPQEVYQPNLILDRMAIE